MHEILYLLVGIPISRIDVLAEETAGAGPIQRNLVPAAEDFDDGFEVGGADL